MSLLALPAFRKQIARLLADRTVVGRTTVDDDHFQNELFDGQQFVQWGGGGYSPVEYPPPHAKADFRVCDWIAHQLSEIHGMPKCELYWPQAKRDSSIAACATSSAIR